MTNISHLNGMLTIEEFGLYFANCARIRTWKPDYPLPTINKIETGRGFRTAYPDPENNDWNELLYWYDTPSYNTVLPNEKYTLSALKPDFARDANEVFVECSNHNLPLQIVFTDVTKELVEFVLQREWPTLYWG